MRRIITTANAGIHSGIYSGVKLPNKRRGFTLIEVLITLVIVAVLAAIAYPLYNSFTSRAQRSAGTSELARIAQLQEGYFFENRAFGDLTDLGFAADTMGLDMNGNLVAANAGVYNVSVTLGDPATTFTVQAAATGTQTHDTGCTALSITSNGTRAPAGCW